MSWKFKFWGFAFGVILSVYLLMPTLLGLKDEAANLTKAGEALPWYHNVLPSDELNLGLDLRGGLYLEMEVGLEEALKHRIDFLAGDVKRSVIADVYKGANVTQILNNRLRTEVSQDKIEAFNSDVVKYFGNSTFLIQDGKYEIILEPKGDAVQTRKAVYEKANSVSGFAGDVTVSEDGKRLFVSYTNETQRDSLNQLFASPENADVVTVVTENYNDITYLTLTDTYLDQMKKDIIEQAANSVRNRIDRFGVAEASVSRQSSDRLVVELPGVKDPDSIIDIIKRTGKLEFRLIDDSLNAAQLRQMIDSQKDALKIDFVYHKQELQKINNALKAELPQNTEIALQLTRDPESGKVTAYTPYLLETTAGVTGDMLDNASVQTDQGRPIVAMSFNKSGAKKFADVTSQNVGRLLGIVLDGTVNSAPRIESGIYGGQAIIKLGFGRFDDLMKEARDVVLVLKEGALPAALTVGTKNIIGPSLGKDSIDAGLKSLIIAAIAVLIFMMLYYKVGGIVANVALIINVLFIFSILTLFQASLTLPGIAGIVLTLGMAVDANVIIFERMREEKYLGHKVGEVIESGYGNAMSAIIDGNITTFISGLVLFEFGTGPIKGFAATLMIGIATSLLTAIVLTRVLNDWLVHSVKVKEIRI